MRGEGGEGGSVEGEWGDENIIYINAPHCTTILKHKQGAILRLRVQNLVDLRDSAFGEY